MSVHYRPHPHHLIQNPLRHIALSHLRNLHRAFRRDEDRRIPLRIESDPSPRHVIQDNRVRALGLHLLPCALHIQLHLRRKRNHQRPCAASTRNIAHNVLGRHQLQMQRAFAPQLLRAHLCHAEVRHCRRADYHGRLRQVLHHRRAHLFRAGHRNERATLRRLQCSGRTDQYHLRAPLPRRLGNRIAHLSAGAVAQEPHRIDRLPRSSRRHQHRLAG